MISEALDLILTASWIGLAIGFILIARPVLGGWLNPVSVYWSVWTCSIIVSRLPFVAGWPLAVETWMAMILAAVIFTMVSLILGFILSPRWFGKKPSRVSCLKPRLEQTYTTRTLLVVFAVCMALSVVQLYLQLRHLLGLVGSWHLLWTEGWKVRRVLVEESSKVAWANLEVPFLTRITSYTLSLGGLALFLGAYLLAVKGLLVGIAPLSVEAIISMLRLERYRFVVSFLLFGFSYWYFARLRGRNSPREIHRRIKNRLRSRKLLAGIIAAVILVFVMWVPISVRHLGIRGRDIALHTLWYLASPVLAFDVRVKNGEPFDGRTTGGASSFWGIAVWLARLGWDVDVPPYHYEPVRFQGGMQTNVFTYLINPLDDWGWPGLVLLPAMMSAVATFLHVMIVRYRRLAIVPVQSIMMATIAMSFYTFMLKDLYYMLLATATILLTPVLIRTRLKCPRLSSVTALEEPGLQR
ncbi:MAG TPA: oligosaccharide repeat unit polymerase [Chloroflexi bacterium]|nr:oligosaccharide repeat unit polymerase [Chloroflexota bacterium]